MSHLSFRSYTTMIIRHIYYQYYLSSCKESIQLLYTVTWTNLWNLIKCSFDSLEIIHFSWVYHGMNTLVYNILSSSYVNIWDVLNFKWYRTSCRKSKCSEMRCRECWKMIRLKYYEPIYSNATTRTHTKYFAGYKWLEIEFWL